MYVFRPNSPAFDEVVAYYQIFNEGPIFKEMLLKTDQGGAIFLLNDF